MQFKEALSAAGLANPGGATWSGTAADGQTVFTVWEHETIDIDGRVFTSWYHSGPLASGRLGTARAYVRRATQNIGVPCRAVILTKSSDGGVGPAQYPHPRMARVQFRFVDEEALQYSAEPTANTWALLGAVGRHRQVCARITIPKELLVVYPLTTLVWLP